MADNLHSRHTERVEAVFYRHFRVYRAEMDSVAEAISFLNSGEDYGSLSSVGVFVDGEPHLTDAYVNDDGGRTPTPEEADRMRADYAKAGEQ
jgi:hypothetical protein